MNFLQFPAVFMKVKKPTAGGSVQLFFYLFLECFLLDQIKKSVQKIVKSL